jgi:outer membrane receptor protein involved in Fe transport
MRTNTFEHPKMQRKLKRWASWAASASLLAILPEAVAQQEDLDIFVMPAFEVSVTEDRGYLSTNAISGTSLNMAIRDLPMPLEVINQEFIEDLQATGLKEALAYSSGVFSQTFQNDSGANAQGSRERSPSTAANVNNPFTNTISIRGYAVPNQQRYGFRVGSIAVGEGFSTVLGGITDTSNVERMEVVRGPASLLYGVNVLSGVVNILPKEPLFERRTLVQLGAGSHDFRRGTLDTTGPLVKDQLAYRLVGNFQNSGAPGMFRKNEQEYYVGQLKWQPSRKLSLLLEGQYADEAQFGIGPKFFRDNFAGQAFEIDKNPTNTDAFRNAYYENIRFGYDLPDHFLTREEDDPDDIWLLPKGNPLAPQENAQLGEDFRISGPDTFFKRKEVNALALLRANPLKGLNIELGGYYTRVQQLERNMDMAVYGNSEGPLSTRLTTKAPASLGPNAMYVNEYVRNPEILNIFGGQLPPVRTTSPLAGGVYLLDEAVGFSVGPDDVPNYIGRTSNVTSGAIGEVFVLPDLIQRGLPGGNPNAFTWNPKVARYMWYERPTDSESIQLRARAAYTFELDTPDWLGGKSRHTLTGGGQFIRDELSVVSGGLNIRNTITYGDIFNSNEPGQGLGKLGQDPYILRQSVFDYTPIRYNGEPMGIPGGLNFSRDLLGSELLDYLGNTGEFKIAGSGWRDLTAYYRGAYAVYQGEFWKDRVTFIGGLRHDSYQIKESELLRVLDGTAKAGTLLTDESQGTGESTGTVTIGYTVLPYLIGDGSQPYTPDRWLSNLPDALNEEIQRQVDLMREGVGPDGTSGTLFPRSQTFNTGTAGISFRVSDPLSVYLLYSEGVFPNQGQRDGLDRPVPAEQTSSREIGVKFDLLDRRISGTVSVYQIRRRNATWNFAEAPAPRKWIGGRLGPNESAFQPWTSGVGFPFDARSYIGQQGVKAAHAGNLGLDDRFQRNSYGVNGDFVKAVWQEQVGTAFPESFNQKILDDLGLGWLYAQSYQIDGARFENRGRQNVPYFWADVNRDLVAGRHITNPADNPNVPAGIDMGLLIKEAFDRAIAARDYDGDPIAWRHNEAIYSAGAGNNPSNVVGDLVTFEEEAFGVDGQMIFTITDNYQAIFTFSYQKREVVGNGFNLAPLVDPITGETVAGTPYDRWIYLLGADAFDDPTDPTTTNGNGVNGLDLSFAPKWNFSLWQKYSLPEGRLRGLELMAGGRFFGEAPTSVNIGGPGSSYNRYPTPPTRERVVFDLGANYSFNWMDVRWRLGLNVNNVLNDRIGESIVEYQDIDDPETTHLRRTRVVYAPRTWRLSLSATF